MIGAEPGRASDDEITLFMGPGVGLQLAALGQAIYQRAWAERAGNEIPSEWFAPS